MRIVRFAVMTLALAGLLFTAACQDDSAPTEPEDTAPTSGGLVREAILPEDQLPEDWRYATQEQFLGKPEMCGVLLEPPSLTGATTQRFTSTSGDRFIIQYSFLSSDEEATTERLDSWAEAVPTCTSFSPGGEVTLDVAQLTEIPSVGESFGAVHAQETSTPENQRDYVAFRNGAHVTVLLSYGLELPERATLAAVTEAVQSHVESVLE